MNDISLLCYICFDRIMNNALYDIDCNECNLFVPEECARIFYTFTLSFDM